MTTKVLHNPRCKKSRDAVAYLESNKIPHQIIKYLEAPPTVNELQTIVKQLGIKPEQLVRKKEKLYKELSLGSARLSDLEWIQLLVDHPSLIERPIVQHEKQAVIGRPLDNVIALFENK
jgi:arsenate reductase